MSSDPSTSSVQLITMGDPCGIGPEIIVRAHVLGACQQTVVIGAPAVLQRAVIEVGAALQLRQVSSLDGLVLGSHGQPSQMLVLAPPGLPQALLELPRGQVHAAAGRAAALCIRHAVSLIQAGQAGALVTAPIHKEALHLAGEPYPGHTELLQALAGGVPVRMMLANEALKTVLVSIHMSLKQAIASLSEENILETIGIAHASARRWGLNAPRIAVAGLNPHAGEGGLFGDEEIRFIAPAIARAQALGIDASGPHAPDTVFMRARRGPEQRGEFDIVIAMYHDQGLIPVKYLGLAHGVNVTLGLPFVRTSPDHGTGFDIVGRGLAQPDSLIAALRMARTLGGGDPGQ